MRCFTGSQCKDFSVADIWSYLPIPHSSLAAAFWTRCSLSKKESGSPYNVAFWQSNLEVTNAWMSVSQFCISRDFRTREMFFKCKYAVWQILFTWLSSLILSSNMTPRFLTSFTGEFISLPHFRWMLCGVGPLDGENTIISVLSVLHIIKLVRIQWNILARHSSIFSDTDSPIKNSI